MKKLPKIGQRVVVKENYRCRLEIMSAKDIVGKVGTVIDIADYVYTTENTLVEFDDNFSDALHTGQGKGENCYWICNTELRKVK